MLQNTAWKLPQELDEDASGCLSLDELLSGYDRLPEFQAGERVGNHVRRQIFNIHDNYQDWAEQIGSG